MNSKHWKSLAQRSLFPFVESILCFFHLWQSSPLCVKITEGILSQSPMYMLFFFLNFCLHLFLFFICNGFIDHWLFDMSTKHQLGFIVSKNLIFSPVVALHNRTLYHFSLKIHHFYVLLSLLKVIYLYPPPCSNSLAWSSSIQLADLFELWYFLYVKIPVSDT